MVILHARSVLLVAAIVWALWRALLWRRGGDKNVARELAVAITFLWSLLIVKVTFFPLTIIFYDWHGASNLTPFASIIQLIREAPTEFAVENIVGNVVLFVPLGVLLPILFDQLKRPVALLWRAAAVSLLIEGTQFLTRARSVDIDDIILNTAGAMIGLGIYRLAASAVDRSPKGRRVLEGLGSRPGREPLLTGALPLLLTAAIAVPMMISTVVGQTLSGGTDGIEAVALADLPDGQIVARGEIEDQTFLITAAETPDRPIIRLSEFEKVMPSRYTWLGTSDDQAGDASSYRSYAPSFNPTAGEQPILVVWGTNADNATAVHITGNGADDVLPLGNASAFVAGIEFAYDESVGVLDEFAVTFLAGDGTAIAGFRHADG